jgi:mannitol-1-phosphate/altronate dehydrogenase
MAGDLLRAKVIERAAASSEGLKDWIEFNCKFPNSFLDRMCAATDETVRWLPQMREQPCLHCLAHISFFSI